MDISSEKMTTGCLPSTAALRATLRASDELPIAEHCFELGPRLLEDRRNVRRIGAAPHVGDSKDPLFSAVGRLLGAKRLVETEAGDVAGCGDQPPSQRVLDDDVGVMTHARCGGRDHAHLADVVDPTGS
jgi:hypothetical protein